jgi:hypothetical protein
MTRKVYIISTCRPEKQLTSEKRFNVELNFGSIHKCEMLHNKLYGVESLLRRR